MTSAQANLAPDRVEAVLLDAFGTLLELEPPGPLLRRRLAEIAGVEVSAAAAAAAFRAEIEHYLDHHLEGRDPTSLARLRDDCAEVVRRSLALPPWQLGAVREAMLGALRFTAHADAAPALSALRQGGLRLVVASNWDCSLPRALEAAGLSPVLDAVVPSAVVGAAKPDPRLFAVALAAAGVAADRAVHVGDSVVHDVEGARAAGLTPVLLHRNRAGGDPEARAPGNTPRGGNPPDDVVTIGSLAELPALLFEHG